MKKYKQFCSKVEVDNDDRTITAVISTNVVDRDGEVLKPKGALLDSFLKNPVVQWAHDYQDTPIAKAMWLKTGNSKISAKMKFPEPELSPKADEVYNLFKGGFLNAFSVGFIIKKGHAPEPKEIEKRPALAEANYIIDEWELLEFSAVPVPANPEALVTAVKTKKVELSKETQKDLGFNDEGDMLDEDGEVIYTLADGEPVDKTESEPDKVEVIRCQHIVRPVILSAKTFRPIRIVKQFCTKKPEQAAIDILNRMKGKVYG